MEELVRRLDENLRFDEYKICGDQIYVHVRSKRDKAKCPYCGYVSQSIHSRKVRTLKDLPIQGMKVKLQLAQKKYFYKNEDCGITTFAESFDFYEPKATKTKRLQEEIMRAAMTQSSVSASRYLRKHVADVGKSTICNMIKKGHGNKCG
jgi:transposase